tara:strand:- start:21 stop:809 length:789 start_codon:yes stop_codon:yes gene_type:complete
MSSNKWFVLVISSVVFITSGCAYLSGLIPKEAYYEVILTPNLSDEGGAYTIDPDDPRTIEFSHEGMVVRIRPYTDNELNGLYPPLFDGRHTNPYTTDIYETDLGYVPPIFTVFDIEVVNQTYAKIEFDPAKTMLKCDTGAELRYYDPGRAGEGVDPLGGNKFNAYYQTERGRSGLDKDINLERMGMIYKTAFHRFRPVFRGDKRSGKLAFAILPKDVTSVTLSVREFILAFNPSGGAESTIDFECSFDVNQGIVKTELDPLY